MGIFYSKISVLILSKINGDVKAQPSFSLICPIDKSAQKVGVQKFITLQESKSSNLVIELTQVIC